MSERVLFQTIQFIIQKRFHVKQLSLTEVCSSNIKTVVFQTILFI